MYSFHRVYKEYYYLRCSDIINNGFGFNNNIINESQFKKLKLKPDEGTIFKIICNDNNDNNNNDDINDSLESEKEEEN